MSRAFNPHRFEARAAVRAAAAANAQDATADQLRRDYILLAQHVSRAVHLPERTAALPGGIDGVRHEVLLRIERFTSLGHVLPQDELNTAWQNMHQMLADIDASHEHVADPPNEGVEIELRSGQDTDSLPSRGRPRIDIDADVLRAALVHRSQKDVGIGLGCCSRTVRRRAVELGIRPSGPVPFVPAPPDHPLQLVRNPLSRGHAPGTFSTLSNRELDEIVAEVIRLYPSAGRRLVMGHMRTQGIVIQRARVIASIRRVTGAVRRWRYRIDHRRVYRVAGPNSIWHHDGQHGLIRWRIVIHAFIDGYSRFILGIRANNNNRAETVLALFIDACVTHGVVPHRSRGDCGTENLGVCECINNLRGEGAYIWGRSVDNIRIERLWVDVVRAIVNKWYSFFRELEAFDGLDVRNENHVWLLHKLFLDMLNHEITNWANMWNQHPMDIRRQDRSFNTRSADSPASMYLWGMQQNGPRGFDIQARYQTLSAGLEWAAGLEFPEDADEGSDADDLDVEYGVDWEAAQDPRILRSHRANNPEDYGVPSAEDGFDGSFGLWEDGGDDDISAPQSQFLPRQLPKFSHVEVIPPSSFAEPLALQLANYVSGHPGTHSSSIALRRLLWRDALAFMTARTST